jgi:type I restriction enzyme, S subunit
MDNWANTTAQPTLNLKEVAEIPIPIPPPIEQKAIADILGTLDDKIELNRRMNATLEAMARALFQSWFINFDPVRAKLDDRKPPGIDAETVALFPDGFQESELGPIPKGWVSGTLGEIAVNPRIVVDPINVDRSTPYIALEHMPRRSIALGDWGESADLGSGKFQFNEGDILFGKLRPYFHKVGIAPIAGICSTDILVIRPKTSKWFGFLLGHSSSDKLIQFTDRASTGTKMPRTNWKDFASFKVPIPPSAVGHEFTRIIQPMIDRIVQNVHQSRTLTALRDTLLPKLLSGDIRL